jgi:hypothetical protein
VHDLLELMRAIQKLENNGLIERPSFRKAIFAVPFERDHHFVSRGTLSSTIEDQLEHHRRAVLYGGAGTG